MQEEAEEIRWMKEMMKMTKRMLLNWYPSGGGDQMNE